jgi:hypothetical protein
MMNNVFVFCFSRIGIGILRIKVLGISSGIHGIYLSLVYFLFDIRTFTLRPGMTYSVKEFTKPSPTTLSIARILGLSKEFLSFF